MRFVHLLSLAVVGALATPLAPAPDSIALPPPAGGGGGNNNNNDGSDGKAPPKDDYPGMELPHPPRPPSPRLAPPSAAVPAGLAGLAAAAASSSPPPTASTDNPRNPDCTSTVTLLGLRNGTFTHGPVRTVWATTVTVTEHRDCRGCRFLAVDSEGGHGPVVHFTTTVTESATPRTETALACLKTAAVATGAPPATQSPSPPPALPTPSKSAS